MALQRKQRDSNPQDLSARLFSRQVPHPAGLLPNIRMTPFKQYSVLPATTTSASHLARCHSYYYRAIDVSGGRNVVSVGNLVNVSDGVDVLSITTTGVSVLFVSPPEHAVTPSTAIIINLRIKFSF